jgi:hypothetical protein
MQAERRSNQLQALVADSLGDPAFYRTSIDKTQISGGGGRRMVIPVPAHRVVTSLDEADRLLPSPGLSAWW